MFQAQATRIRQERCAGWQIYDLMGQCFYMEKFVGAPVGNLSWEVVLTFAEAMLLLRKRMVELQLVGLR